MRAKKLINKIYELDYTIGYEKNNIPLSDYDEGFKAACNVIIGIAYGLSWTFLKYLWYKLYFWDIHQK